ncbi:MAG TPA: PTS fructose transporter subunit IIA [Smithella sp.]|nr:PTS fructose transporter subunit IIA [Smithella sp.]
MLFRREMIMIGVLITTHGNLGNELIKSAELIKGPLNNILHICVDQAEDVEDLKKEISNAIKKLDKGKGVLVLTDLFGGTPSNISLSFMKEGKVEVLTGVNLPMVLKLSEVKEDMTLRDFACLIKNYGEKNIMLASEILSKKASR